MNKQIRRLTLVAIAMILAVMISATMIQFFLAPSYLADERNQRALYASLARDRGPIIVAGKRIATSVPVEDNFKYLRQYPGGAPYSLLTGYQSISMGNTGLEWVENDVLSGTAPMLLTSRIQTLFTGSKPRGGAVELTINPKVQLAAWNGLGTHRGAAVALDVKTGAILAAVSTPSFDANKLSLHDTAQANKNWEALLADPNKPTDNRAFGGHLYPPGSTFKIVTLAAALAKDPQLNPNTEIDAPPSLKLPDSSAVLYNYHKEECGSGRVTIAEAFARSCNTPFASLGMHVGPEALQAKAKDFGFNQGFDMPLSVTASAFPKELNRPQTAMSAIGQYDVQASPMQMAMIAAAVGNKGTMMRPFLIHSVLDGDLELQKQTAPVALAQPMSPTVAAQISQLMAQTVDLPFGTGTGLRLPGIKVAAKSGTAELGEAGQTIAWMVGFAPVEDPKIAFAVAVEGDPNWVLSPSGGVHAAPIAKAMVQAGLLP